MNTETYRSGHNGADSKSVREQSPASSNLAVSAKKQNAFAFCFYLGEIRSRPLRKSSCGRFLGRSVDETFPQNVNTRFEIEVFYFMISRRLRQKTERFCVLFFNIDEIRNRPLRKSSCGRFLGRSVDETFPQNVNTRFEIEVFYFMISRRLRQKNRTQKRSVFI